MPNTKTAKGGTGRPATIKVTDDVFRQVYDSPTSLPGRFRWVTTDKDVRKIEKLLGMKPETIGVPLWVSGNKRNCLKCGRETNWLDIVASGLSKVHRREMIAKVILGKQKYINIEAPKAIADLNCYKCKTKITDLRSFKCHNWAYASPAMQRVLSQMAKSNPKTG